MTPIFCKSNICSVVNRLQDYLMKGGTIKGVRLVDQSDEQVVLLIDSQPIDQNQATAWWEGFKAALETNINES